MGCLAIAYVGARSVSQWVAPLALLVLATTVVGNPPSVIVPVALTWQERAEVKHVVQNKHGIIHQLAFAGDPGGDWTYGGNIYDGRINVDMKVNSNQLERSYLLAVLHPSPRRALVIGLSSGANAAVIAGFPGIEVVDVVEINPGYLEIIRMYPEVSPLLADPRVRVHIADARQWLRAHPESRYDLIFQNTTYHWRAYSTQLLSSEYLRELRKHLADGGIAAINTTNSVDLYRTAIDIFTNVVRYNTFAYMSDRPITVRADAERVLRESRIGGLPAFDESLFVSGGIGSRLLSVRPESAQEFIDKSLLEEAPRLITDLNLIPEFRHGQPPLFGALSPLLPPTPLAR
jgi:hypothetical protein